jgi:death on curing protein
LIEPVWLSAEPVIAINQRVVMRTGEPFLLRDRGLLESALGKAPNRYHYDRVEDVVSLAATLLFGIARNHPFEQGNKRTGFLSAVYFLEINGYALEPAPDSEKALGLLITYVLEQGMSEEGFADVVRMVTRAI